MSSELARGGGRRRLSSHSQAYASLVTRRIARHVGSSDVPRTFLFDRDGKLLAAAIDQQTRKQFLTMLTKIDLHD